MTDNVDELRAKLDRELLALFDDIARTPIGWRNFAIPFLAGFNSKLEPSDVASLTGPPEPNETAVLAPYCPKTAALCNNRVWGFDVPKEIRFTSGMPFESDLLQYSKFFSTLDGQLSPASLQMFGTLILERSFPNSLSGNGFQRLTVVASAMERQLNRRIPIVFPSSESADEDYATGSTTTIVALFSNLEVVDEDSTEWQQVIEFRKDADAMSKFKRFVHWLDKEMVGKSRSYIEDDIAERLSDYKKTLAAHGLKTRLGIMSTLIDKDALIASAATSLGIATTGQEVLAAIAGLGVLIGKTSLSVAEKLVELNAIKDTKYPEVAYVYDALAQFERPAT